MTLHSPQNHFLRKDTNDCFQECDSHHIPVIEFWEEITKIESEK